MNRANYIIIEESRLVPKEILEQVIKPFLEVRMPNYMTLDEYKDIKELREDGVMSFITSAWYTAEYWYTYVRSCILKMASGDESANFLAFDYLITLKSGIKTEKMIRDEMDDTDDLTVQMEYYNIPSGSSGKSYFPLKLFQRNLKKAFYPMPEDEYNSKKNKYDIPKEEGEIRFVTVDVATRANKANDNSIIACIRLIPSIGRGFERHLCYMESHKGQHVGVQAKRIKEIFYDFSSDFCCLDLQNAGIGVFDSLSENTIDDERDITYPPFTVVDETYDMVKDTVRDDLRNNHTRGLNALPVIFPISASEDLNSQIATALKISLQKKMWKLLISEGDAEDYLIKSTPEFTKDVSDSDTFAWFLNPYVNVGLFISECINLDLKPIGDKIKLIEKAGCYKDRYSAISYCNFVISTEFDKWLLKEKSKENDWDIISGLFQMY